MSSISINNNKGLRKIEGFNQVDFLGTNDIVYRNYSYFLSLSIAGNENLATIEGFEKLKKLNANLIIAANDKLISMPDFNNIDTIVGGCLLDLPKVFLSQVFLKNLKSVNGILRSNITNFNALEHIGHLSIVDEYLCNDTLSGFESVHTIGLLEIDQTMDWMYANTSATAQRGALDWRHKFRDLNEPLFDELYNSVASGKEADRVIEANGRADYRSQLESELKEIRESEMWQTGAEVRKLRLERN